MVTLNKESITLNLVNSDKYIKEYQACGLNSILALLEYYKSFNKLDVNEIKNIFNYNEDGISLERYRFNKLNTYLNKMGVPYRFYISKFESLSDLYKMLNDNQPIPIFFWIKVLNFTKKHYKNLEYQMDFGDIEQSDTKHMLILVGYANKGEKLIFIDPSYQIPWISQSTKELSKYYFLMDTKDFYECSKHIHTYICIKFLKSEVKRYDKTISAKETQQKLE